MPNEYIKKSKALDELNYIVQYYGGKSMGAIEAHETIYMMEPEDVRPVVRGRWEWTVVDDEYFGEYWKCNLCGEHSNIEYNFCPNCGADMRETEPQKCDTCSHGAHWDGVVICGKDGQRHERTDKCDKGGATMKLTSKEQEICDKYSAYDKSNRVHCYECPLAISRAALVCYANIDGRTKEAKELKRR